ncbi:MAG: hypothetical protein F4Y25_06115 [Chloroflexi bacterium]|nr:hypothetical protein [Chloroflexota bacterium]
MIRFLTSRGIGRPAEFVTVTVTLIALVLAAAGCVATATPTPVPTATPTPVPTATPTPVPADESVLGCMLDVACSGLFRDGTVYKSPILDHMRYWVSPDMPPALRDVIVSDTMPTLGKWMGISWEEADERPAAFTALIWLYEPPYVGGADSPECLPGEKTWVACAHHRDGSVQLRDEHRGARIPPEYSRESAMHEALHILYRATHAERGIMCVDWPICGGRDLASGGFLWQLRLSDLDAAVYSLFAHPAIEHRATLEEVAALFGL